MERSASRRLMYPALGMGEYRVNINGVQAAAAIYASIVKRSNSFEGRLMFSLVIWTGKRTCFFTYVKRKEVRECSLNFLL